jgi:uncharacterized protein (DUF2236 family)
MVGHQATSAGTGAAESYFAPDSMLRTVIGERVVALSGPRALLMQAAHPLAVAGLLAHSSALDEPYERLKRTAEVMNAVGFGTREEADRVTRRVRAMHSRVSGELEEGIGPYPAGTPYRAGDPDLLLWVLFTLVDSAELVFSRYVRKLSHSERAGLWADYRIVGRLFGLAESEMPADLDELAAYRREMLEGDRLHVSEWARDRAREIVLEPPVPLAVRPLLETANFITIALLPDRIREQYGFAPLPPIGMRRALVGAGSEYIKRVVLPVIPQRLRLIPQVR